MKSSILKTQAISFAGSQLWKKVKDIKTISLGLHYTTKTHPDIRRGKEFTLDVEKTADKTKEYAIQLANFMKGRNKSMTKFKIIWLNEMGEEQVAYVDSKAERDTKMQALADDGYSPVWRDAE